MNVGFRRHFVLSERQQLLRQGNKPGPIGADHNFTTFNFYRYFETIGLFEVQPAVSSVAANNHDSFHLAFPVNVRDRSDIRESC